MSRRQCHPALLGLAVFLLAGTESPAAAQPAFQPPEQDRARDAVRDGRLLPLSQVLAAIAARSP
ncbi:MAG: hypothetical protein IM641_06025, partial [Phenylobacterium sp.]|nr:hypothetical protein [Phenylobacterium sp.]